MSEELELHKFSFAVSAGVSERRVLMSEIADWLRATVGSGCFSANDNFTPTGFEQSMWIIVPYSDNFEV